MLKFSKPETRVQKQCEPNVLPCRIHHDGPVDASPRYWAPKTAQDGQPEAYFRGRKLKGQEIDVPQGYRGVIVKEAGKERTSLQNTDVGNLEREEGEEEPEEVTVLNEVGSFDRVVVWSHETRLDEDDAFVKGLGEWIGFAEAINAPGDENTS